MITALIFRNLLPVLTTHLFGDLGDPLLNTAIIAWNAKRLPLSSGWWNFPAFAPLSGVTAFTEHLLGAYPLTSPIVWFTGNPVLAYNDGPPPPRLVPLPKAGEVPIVIPQ